jgi:hypothetical protein
MKALKNAIERFFGVTLMKYLRNEMSKYIGAR